MGTFCLLLLPSQRIIRPSFFFQAKVTIELRPQPRGIAKKGNEFLVRLEVSSRLSNVTKQSTPSGPRTFLDVLSSLSSDVVYLKPKLVEQTTS